MKKLILSFFIVTLSLTTSAQSEFNCGFDSLRSQIASIQGKQDRLDQLEQKIIDRREELIQDQLANPNSHRHGKASTPVQAKFVIPVVFHVIHLEQDTPVGSGSNISSAQIEHQLEILNHSFRNESQSGTYATNTGIQFCLAKKDINGNSTSGIMRESNSSLSDFNINSEQGQLTDPLFPKEYYLNIYVVRNIYDGGVGDTTWVGVGTFPLVFDFDGILFKHSWIGDYGSCSSCTLDSNSNGLALVHEAGHYLGLYHTFQGNCTGITDTTCSFDGDKCCDTPQEDGATWDCIIARDGCTEETSQPDMMENYMCYSRDCWNTFTQDQSNLMYSTLFSYRSQLIEASNIKRTLATGCDLHTALFSASPSILCDSGMVLFTALDTGRTEYIWTILDISGDTILEQSMASDSLSWIINIIGKYTISLKTITSANDTLEAIRTNYIEVADCQGYQADEQGNWYFGEYAGLKFTALGAVPNFTAYGDNLDKRTTLNCKEGSVTQSDSLGNLLFYGGPTPYGFELYNSLHRELKGAPIGKGVYSLSSLQSGVVVPHPDSSNWFYLIFNQSTSSLLHDDSLGGLYYSIIDMNGDNGLGEIMTGRNEVPISGNSNMSHNADSAAQTNEGLTAVPRCDGKSYWIITHDYSNFAYINLFLLAGDSIKHNSRINVGTKFQNSIAVSPNGTKIYVNNKLLEFNRCDGSITIIKSYTDDFLFSCFSSNSRFLYYIKIGGSGSTLYQEDLQDANYTSRVVGYPIDGPMMLGPDGRIYIAQYIKDYMAVVNSPNKLNRNNNNECGFIGNEVTLSKNGTSLPANNYGLPNMITAKRISDIPLDFTAISGNCLNVNFSTFQCCENTYEWFFGDGDEATGRSPSHTYSTNGTYEVKLIVGDDSITKTIKLEIDDHSILGSTNICDTSTTHSYSLDNHTLDKYEYSWWISGLNNSVVIDYQIGADVVIKSDGSIFVEAMGDYGCKDTVSLDFETFLELDNKDILFDGFYCPSDTLILIEGGEPSDKSMTYTYKWYSSDVDSFNLDLLSNETNKDLLVQANQIKKYYYREVFSSNCSGASQVVTTQLGALVTNNFTVDPHIYVCMATDATINLTTPSGGNGNYTYSWFEELSGGALSMIDGAINDSYSPLTIGKYYRKVYSAGCYNLSDVSEVFTPLVDKSISNGLLCHIGYNAVITSGPNTGLLVDYLWEYSDDEMSWTSTSVTSQNLTFPQFVTQRYYRRKIVIQEDVQYPVCTYYTSSVLVKPEITYTNQPFNDTICENTMSEWSFSCSLINLGNVTSWDTNFYYKNSGDTTWYVNQNSGLSVSGNSSYSSNVGNMNGDSVRFELHSGTCGSIYSESAKIVAISTNSPITFDTSSRQLSAGDWIKFSVQVLGNVDSSSWQVKSINGQWGDVISNEWDTLWVYDLTECEDGNLYRFVSSNMCGTHESDSVLLRVYDFSDLWMKDSDKDTGAIPNTFYTKQTITRDIFMSPDLWNRQSDTTGDIPENPEYDPEDSNYVRVTVRNRGVDSSQPENLYLYWTLGSTGEKWDKHWIASSINRFHNLDSSKWFPTGSEINIQPIAVPQLAPDESITLNRAWSPPNPDWYYTVVGGQRIYDDRINVCLLARIERCEPYPHKMEIDEVFNIHVAKNVINNNNIVTRNLWVENADTMGIKSPWWRFRDADENPGELDFGARIDDVEILSEWDLQLDFDDVMWNAWNDNGAQGTGFSLLPGEQAIKIIDPNLKMDDIELEIDDIGHFQLTMTPIDPNLLTIGTYDLVFEQYQHEDTIAEGGVVFQLVVPAQTSLPPLPKEDVLLRKPIVEWYPQPNPANQGMEIIFNLKSRRHVEIEIYNVLGQKVDHALRSRYKSGANSLFFDASQWPNGIYIIQFKYDHYSDAKRLVINRE